jgi:hypothetical protein
VDNLRSSHSALASWDGNVIYHGGGYSYSVRDCHYHGAGADHSRAQGTVAGNLMEKQITSSLRSSQRL